MEIDPILVLGLIIGIAIGLALGGGGLYLYQSYRGKNRLQAAEEAARQKLVEAEQQIRDFEREAREEIKNERREADEEASRRRIELNKEDERLRDRQAKLDSRLERMELREQNLNKRQSRMDKQRNELARLEEERMAELSRIAEMTLEEAKEHLLVEVEKETRQDMARRIRETEDILQSEAEERARYILSTVMQRIATEHISELSISVVPLPSDEMKGRIIGRAGRNIRAFEQATGVDVVVDDTPEAVTISSFDPVRREVAKRAMARLVLDGRIHPARIEKLVADARKEVERVIKEEGERAAYEASVPGLHPQIIRTLGMLNFRTSYGQNQLSHAIETAHIAGMLAAEIGADISIAKAGGLLHDIGKAIDHDVEGTHAQIGADLCRRHGVRPEIVSCVASHHHESEQDSVEAIIVEIADAISGARPGARRESLDAYVKRIRALEDIANGFGGVQESFALQAGREVRIIVKPDEVDDLAAIRLAKDIAGQIEESMQYPGQIKVTIIRETRSVDYAK
ncbi:MAG: ribonuclease Y [Anaerolineae bacterium]|nr:ribonuclease Y [Anaerolineae bacterium]